MEEKFLWKTVADKHIHVNVSAVAQPFNFQHSTAGERVKIVDWKVYD